MNIASKAALVATLASMLTMSTSSAAEPASKRAVWAEHDVTVELQHLDKRYSCDNLNRKIHDILATIGARDDLQVEASRCGPDLDSTQVAPWVHVNFALPFEVSGERADFADIVAIKSSVSIEPGKPLSIDAADCQLLQQLTLTLFAEVLIQIDPGHLRCRSSLTQQIPFSISLDVLLPAPGRPG